MMKIWVSNRTDVVVAHIFDARNRSLEAAGRIVTGEVNRLLRRGNRSGDWGTVPETGVPYRMSAPGEPPAPRTGDLANSYRYQFVGPTTVRVGSDVEQAELEFGTIRTEPRPHLRPAISSSRRAIERATGQEFEL